MSYIKSPRLLTLFKKNIIKDNNCWKSIVIVFLVISLVSISVLIITKPITTDEGWFHSLALAKDNYGYYTFPPFYDISLLKGNYTLGKGVHVQIFRFFDLVFKNPIAGIILNRFLFFGIWLLAIYLYIREIKPLDNKWNNILIGTIILIHPIMLGSFSTARPEIPMSALLLYFFWNYHRSLNKDYKLIVLIFISTLLFLFHPNGILYMLLLMIIGFNLKQIGKTLKLWIWGIMVGLVYFLIFIDANHPLYIEQFKLIMSTGAEEKFISSMSSLPNYILCEIRDRYIGWESRMLFSYPVLLISTITPLFAGIYAGFKNKRFKVELIYILATIFFFILLGNKFQGYLAYIIPFLIIMSFYLLRKKIIIIKMVSILILFLYITITIRGVVWNYEQNKITKIIIKNIQEKVKPGETVYAPFRFEPYLSPKYDYLTTTQKSKNNLYKIYDIHPQSCVIIAGKNDEIWNWAGENREKIAEIDGMVIQRIY